MRYLSLALALSFLSLPSYGAIHDPGLPPFNSPEKKSTSLQPLVHDLPTNLPRTIETNFSQAIGNSSQALDSLVIPDFSYSLFANPVSMGSAFRPGKGEIHHTTTSLVIQTVELGITDHLSFRGGFEFVSTMSFIASNSVVSKWGPTFFLEPSIGVPIAPNAQVRAGIHYSQLFGNQIAGPNTILSLGGPSQNVSLGYAHYHTSVRNQSIPFHAFQLSGMFRISPRWFFLTDNIYFQPTERWNRPPIFSWLEAHPLNIANGYLCLGARYFPNPKIALSFALFTPISNGPNNPLLLLPLVRVQWQYEK